jgi:hypothetical protein
MNLSALYVYAWSNNSNGFVSLLSQRWCVNVEKETHVRAAVSELVMRTDAAEAGYVAWPCGFVFFFRD